MLVNQVILYVTGSNYLLCRYLAEDADVQATVGDYRKLVDGSLESGGDDKGKVEEIDDKDTA